MNNLANSVTDNAIWRLRLYWLVPIISCVALSLIVSVDYLLFHMLAELWAVTIGFMIFWFCWHTHKFNANNFLLIIAIGYLAVAILDLFHAAIFRDSTNQAAQLWVTARFLEVMTIILSVIFGTGRISRVPVLLVALVVSGVSVFLVLTGRFPDAHIDGSLTELKVFSEYLIILLLLIAGLMIWRAPSLNRTIKAPLLVAICITISSELCFTLYTDPTNLPNIIGHLLKVCSFWIIFCLILLKNLDEPYLALEKNTAKFRSFYESSPTAIWIENFVPLYQVLDELRDTGVEDLEAYLKDSPEKVMQFSQLIEVVEVNAKTLSMFKAHHSENFLSNIAMSFSDTAIADFKNELLAIWRRDEIFVTQTKFRDLGGEPIDVLLTVPIPKSIEEAEEVMVSILDISKELLAEVETEKAQRLMFSAAIGTLNAVSATIEKRDPYTSGHQEAVAELAVKVAEHLAWDTFRIQGLHFAASIHNIGNVYVPADILNRPGALSEPEKGILNAHPSVGADILSKTELAWPVSRMILQHHERLDGSGYPHGLKGNEIMQESLVIGISDMTQAMTSHRPYRPALAREATLEELRTHGPDWYGQEICDACEKALGELWSDRSDA